MSKAKEEAAKVKLEEALREYLEAVDYGDGLLTEWIIVTAQHLVDGDGSATALAVHVSRELPAYRALGLSQYAVLKTTGALSSP